jgi:hypothetical protein
MALQPQSCIQKKVDTPLRDMVFTKLLIGENKDDFYHFQKIVLQEIMKT